MVTHTRKVLDSSASDQNNTVFLKIMADTRDISSNFDAVGQTYTSYFTKSELGFFGVVV
mgnify:FL=1